MHTSGEGAVGVGFSGNCPSENACLPQSLDETQRSVAPERLIIDMPPIEMRVIMRPMSPGLRCAKCDWPLAHREGSLALARTSSRRYANEHRYHSITNAKVGGCESAALLGVRSAAHTCHGCALYATSHGAQELAAAQRIEG